MKLTDTQLQDLATQLRCPQGNDALKTGEMMNLTNGNIIDKTIRSLDIQPNDTILEIGPGNGAHVKKIVVDSTATYTGIDISESMLAEAQKLNSKLPNATFQLTNADVIPFGESKFNKVFTVNTIYFWNDAQAYANQIAQVLKPGGLVSIGFIPKSTMQHIPFAKFGFNLYTIHEVATLFTNAGLKIVSKDLQSEFVTSNSGAQIEREFVILTAEKVQAVM